MLPEEPAKSFGTRQHLSLVTYKVPTPDVQIPAERFCVKHSSQPLRSDDSSLLYLLRLGNSGETILVDHRRSVMYRLDNGAQQTSYPSESSMES